MRHARCTGLPLKLLEQPIIFLLINRDVLIERELGRHVHRKSVRRVQIERVLATESIAGRSRAPDCGFEHLNSAVNRRQELRFLGFDDAAHARRVFSQLWKRVSHARRDDIHKLIQKCVPEPELLISESNGATDHRANHRITAFVAGQRAVGDGERRHSRMISNHSKRDIAHQVLVL